MGRIIAATPPAARAGFQQRRASLQPRIRKQRCEWSCPGARNTHRAEGAGHLQQLRDLRKEPAFLQGAQTALKRCLVLRETGAYVCAGGHAIKLLSKVV